MGLSLKTQVILEDNIFLNDLKVWKAKKKKKITSNDQNRRELKNNIFTSIGEKF